MLGGFADSCSVVQGTKGAVSSLPPCLVAQVGAMAESQAAEHCLIRWEIPQVLAAGQFLLLVQMLRELKDLQQVMLLHSAKRCTLDS